MGESVNLKAGVQPQMNTDERRCRQYSQGDACHPAVRAMVLAPLVRQEKFICVYPRSSAVSRVKGLVMANCPNQDPLVGGTNSVSPHFVRTTSEEDLGLV